MGKEKEVPFQLYLARIISGAGHKVGLIDASREEWPLRFSTLETLPDKSTKGGIKPDLVIQLNETCSLASVCPIIAIETKTDGRNSISEAIDGIIKVIQLREKAKELRYHLAGNLIPSPSIHLLATPLSVSDGILCRWREKEISSGVPLPLPPEVDSHLTHAIRLLLGKRDCGILLRKTFYAKIDGQSRKVVAPW